MIFKTSLAIIIIAFILQFYIFEQQETSVPLDPPTGKFIHLSFGKTRYNLLGPENGKLIVFVHGFSSHYEIFGDHPQDLAKKGYKVLLFDLYGRGYSNSPISKYSVDFFVHQLAELLFALNLNQPFTLIGYSMGGGIATKFAYLFPDKVEKLVLIAPVGIPVPITGRMFIDIPIIGDILFHLVFPMQKAKFIDEVRGDQKILKIVQEIVSVSNHNNAFSKVLLNTLRNYPFDDASILGDAIRQVGKHSREVLLVWGEADKTVPFANSKELLKYMPKAKLLNLGNTTHYCFLQEYKKFQDELINFLK